LRCRRPETVNFAPLIEKGHLPTPKSSENRPVCSGQNRLDYGLVRQAIGLVELVYCTGLAELILHAIEPQLFWRINNRTPFQSTHRGPIPIEVRPLALEGEVRR
jgi:hypothetical protein